MHVTISKTSSIDQLHRTVFRKYTGSNIIDSSTFAAAQISRSKAQTQTSPRKSQLSRRHKKDQQTGIMDSSNDAAAIEKLDKIKSEYRSLLPVSQLIFDLINARQTPLGIIHILSQQQQQHHQESTSTTNFTPQESLQNLIIALACDVPFSHAPLVALLRAFYDCPDERTRDIIFSTFGMYEGDTHSAIECDPSRAAEYVNINAFEAQLWAAMRTEVEDYILGHPIRNLARGVEGEGEEGGGQSAEMEVAAAAVWVVHGGRRIWGFCHGEGGREGDGGWDRRGNLWKGEMGYSVERWRFWRERFEVWAEGGVDGVSLGGETRRLVQAAVGVMNAVEAVDA